MGEILRLCLGVWRGGEGKSLTGGKYVRENREIFLKRVN